MYVHPNTQPYSQALERGKITSPNADYHKAQCRTEGGLDRFKAYLEAAPLVADDSGLDGQKPQSDSALSDEEKPTAAGKPAQAKGK